MFYTPKPRQFHYNPRYYDPEREKWEDIKQKYGYSDEDAKRPYVPGVEQSPEAEDAGDAELRYFEEKVRAIERGERTSAAKFGWKDLVRRREMPQFHYTPRFQDDGTLKEEAATAIRPKTKIKIGRRFDFDDEDYMKPMPAGKIMLYALLAAVLLYWIIF